MGESDGQDRQDAPVPAHFEINGLVVSRRRLLGWLAASGGVLIVGSDTTGLGPLGTIAKTLAKPPPPPPPPATLLIARGLDGLLLNLSLVNLDIVVGRSGPDKLVLRNRTQAGLIVLGLPSQSLFEEAVFDTSSDPAQLPAPPTVPARALMSGPSRLVLRVPAGSGPINFDLTTLLDLAAFPPEVSSVAKQGSGTTLPTAPPSATETAIEAPWRLILSPTADAAFSSEPVPVTRQGRTELWHARAIPLVDGAPAEQRLPVPIRAIWTPDLATCSAGGFPLDDDPPTGVSLTAAHRRKLVAATTTNSVEQGEAAPAGANLLLVSSMGASLDVRGAWPDRNDVVAWRHRSYLARDNYVKVEEPGFLFPFGFRAVLVSITDRILGGGYAFLRKRQFIVVREPTLKYETPVPDNPPTPGALGQRNQGRNLPFKAVTTTTLVSPPIIPAGPSNQISGTPAFWVQVAGPGGGAQDLQYKLELTGQDGGAVTSDLPLIFVPAGVSTITCDSGGLATVEQNNPAYNLSTMGMVITSYNLTDASTRRTLVLNGQKLGYVPRLDSSPAGPPPEETALPTSSLVLEGEPTEATQPEHLAARRLAAYPKMDTAQVRLEALEAVGGTGQAGTAITLHDAYTANGFGGAENAGEVWANVEDAVNLAVPQQTGGGLAAPSVDVGGLSRAFGPVTDLDQIRKGEFKPENYFDKVTLLGGIPLSAVIAPIGGITDPRTSAGDNVPKVVTRRTDTAIETVINWRPTLQKALDGLFDPAPEGSPDRRMDLQAVFRTDLATGASTTVVRGELRNFTLNFVNAGDLQFIQQDVVRLRFESHNGGKPNVDVQLGRSQFKGDLAFLTDLQELLPALPGGIKIDVTPRGVQAGISLPIPSIPIGVVLVENLTIGVLLDLPFNGDQAVLTFNFATREHCFHVTVMGLGGGGFLGIGLGTRGVQRIEGALEFGASVALDFGVASGSVSIMAGIHFIFAQRKNANGTPALPAGDTVVITGYVRALGELEVLELIHVSVEFYLGLTYTNKAGAGTQGKVEGTATLTVRVEVLLFSTEVSLTVHKEFAAGPDPFFGDQITAGDWAAYCAAFAA